VNAGEEFPAHKFSKIEKFEIVNLYVKNYDKQEYFQYLNQYLSSDEGQELREKIANSEEELPVGFPTEEEFTLTALTGEVEVEEEIESPGGNVEVVDSFSSLEPNPVIDEPEVEGDGSLETENPAIELKNSDEAEGELSVDGDVEDEAAVEASNDPEEDIESDTFVDENIGEVQAPPEAEGPMGEVLNRFRSQLEEMESIYVQGGVSEEEKVTIGDCTLHLKEELVKISGDIENKELDETALSRTKLSLLKHIKIFDASLSENTKKLLGQPLSELREKLEQLDKLKDSENLSPTQVKRFVNSVVGSVKNLEKASNTDVEGTVSLLINRLLDTSETHLGTNVHFSEKYGRYNNVPEHILNDLSMDDILASNNNDIKYFHHKIIKQNLIIQTLYKNYKKTLKALTDLKEKWLMFTVSLKRRLEVSDAMTVAEIDDDLAKFHAEQLSMHDESVNLKAIAAALVTDMGGKHLEIDHDLLARIGAEFETQRTVVPQGEGRSQTAGEPGTGEAGTGQSGEVSEGEFSGSFGKDSGSGINSLDLLTSDEGEEIDLEGGSSGAETSRLKSELEVLKTQLENSQKLNEAGSIKINELSEVIEKNNEHTEHLEEENEFLGRQNLTLNDDIERLRANEALHQGQFDDANKEISDIKAELEVSRQTIQDLSTKLESKRSEIKDLKRGSDVAEATAQKDKVIDELEAKLERKQDQLKAKSKEANKLSSKISAAEQKYRDINSKFERQKQSMVALKKQNRTAMVKAEGAKNALQQARKSISKLTTMSETLRSDRQKYILETNKNLEKFRAMTSHANSLTRKMGIENQKTQALTSELDKLKSENEKLIEKLKQLSLKKDEAA
tara:strand:- start:95909 stop:98449 length:2541 start_codon:yes stop_codon:yes gene_type:complete